jgi:STAS domain/Histidine kinase-, DNA gyrase B-, and HSP90-like ATPase
VGLGEIRVSVLDYGTGIPNCEDIVNGFTRSQQPKGLGIGLAGTKRLMNDFRIESNRRGTHVFVAKRKSSIGQSESGKGTTFMIEFPTESGTPIETIAMETQYVEGHTFDQFFELNRDVFNKLIEQHSVDLMSDLDETKLGKGFVMQAAQTIAKLLNQHNEHGLILEAKKNGNTWARHDLSMILELEWLQTLRKLYWQLLASDAIHDGYDVKQFFVAILPIIGAVDTHRAKLIQENVLTNIAELRLERLIIDLSGVAFMDTAVVSYIFRIIEGINLLHLGPVCAALRKAKLECIRSRCISRIACCCI